MPTARYVAEEFAVNPDITPEAYNAASATASLVQTFHSTGALDVDQIIGVLGDNLLAADVIGLMIVMLASYESALQELKDSVEE